jgi:hypothetical protein
VWERSVSNSHRYRTGGQITRFPLKQFASTYEYNVQQWTLILRHTLILSFPYNIVLLTALRPFSFLVQEHCKGYVYFIRILFSRLNVEQDEACHRFLYIIFNLIVIYYFSLFTHFYIYFMSYSST